MKHSVHCLALCSISLLTLPGCGRIVDWAQDTFYQGEKLDDQAMRAREHIRSVRLYNQLITDASFDALWLSDEVRRTYADMYIRRRGKSEERYQAVVRRQLEENSHSIVFYVLTLYRLVLGNEFAQWSISLEIDGKLFTPVEVKWLELSPEYVRIFGKSWNRFKEAYSVRFNAKDTQDRMLINNRTRKVALHFRSVDKEVVLAWDFVDGRIVASKYDVCLEEH